MSRFVRLSLVLTAAALVVACGPDDSAGGETAEVCPPADREVLVDEELARETPSSAFVVDPGDDVWVGLIVDHDVSPSALFSQVTGLYLIDEGAPVEYTRDSVGFLVTDAPYLDYDEQGQFIRLDADPGAYQLWSTKSPEVQVVRCPDER